MPLIDQLPNETLLDIFRHLEPRDIKHVRLVSKTLTTCASKYLVRSVYISGFRKDQEVLKAISERPIFANGVTELVFNSSMFAIFDNNVITYEFKNNYRDLLYRRTRYMLEMTEEEVVLSYWKYLKCCWEQHKSIETGSSVACLAAALPLLPNLVHFRVVSVWDCFCVDGGAPSERSWDMMVLNPGAIVGNRRMDRYEETEKRWMMFFLKLLGTLATTSTKRPLTSLAMDLPRRDALYSFLGISQENYRHWRNAFCHLRSLHLRMTTDTFVLINLGRLLQPMRGLEILRLCFIPCVESPISLTGLLGTSLTAFSDYLLTLSTTGTKGFTLKRLRHLEIDSALLSMEKALDFLRSHAGSLQHLELWDVTFSKRDTWAGFTDWLRW